MTANNHPEADPTRPRTHGRSRTGARHHTEQAHANGVNVLRNMMGETQ